MTEKAPGLVDYSIVIPVYYNEGSLRSTMESLRREVMDANPGRTCEVIFVDDGSGDESLRELLELRKEHPTQVKVIALTRNFGQPYARLAGLERSRGKCVVSISADGQDPPGLINDMLTAHFDDGYEVVACARKGRDESWYRVVTSRLFYWLMKRLSFPNMPLGGFDFVLLSRRALNVVLRNKEAHPFFQGQILWTGFTPKFIYFQRRQREKGKSRWTFGKKLTLLIDGVLSYSYFPICVMSLTGSLLALLGFLYAAFIALRRVLVGTDFEGWSAIMVVLLLTSGVQVLMLGITGEYLWRTLAQIRNRDLYVIAEVYD